MDVGNTNGWAQDDSSIMVGLAVSTTVGRDVPVRRAISAFGNPSAANSTIRARAASPARTDVDRVNASSRD